MSRRSIVMARMRWIADISRDGAYTDSRELWRDSARRFSHIDPAPDAHAQARNALIRTRLRRLRDAQQAQLSAIWQRGNRAAFDAAYRQSAQTLCIVAGLHLAIQRRARRSQS